MKDEKRVPNLRFPEFKESWKRSNFKDLVKLERGSSPRPITKYFTTSEDGVNWIKIGDINKSKYSIDKTGQKITSEGAKKSRRVRKGEIILSNSMSFGKPCILNIDGYIHDGWFVLRDFEPRINKFYLCELLGSSIVQRQYQRMAAGGVVNNISSSLVNSVKFNLPSLSEQQKISSFLSAVDKKIEQLQQKKSLLEAYKKGVMQQLFSQQLRFKDAQGKEYPDWEEKRLGEVGKITGGGTPSTSNPEFWNGTIPWISSSDIKENNIYAVQKTRFLTKKAINASATKIIPKGSIMFVTRVGVGKLAVSDVELCTSQDFASLYPIRDNGHFIAYYFLSRSDLLHRYSQGTSIKGFTTGDLKNIVINKPILEEQIKIANFLSAIDKKIEIINTQIEYTQQFKKGLLQQMFV